MAYFPYASISYSNHTVRFFDFRVKDEKEQVLNMLNQALSRNPFIIRIYIYEEDNVYNIYYLSEGFCYENLSRLYKFYNKDEIVPLVMEIKLLNNS